MRNQSIPRSSLKSMKKTLTSTDNLRFNVSLMLLMLKKEEKRSEVALLIRRSLKLKRRMMRIWPTNQLKLDLSLHTIMQILIWTLFLSAKVTKRWSQSLTRSMTRSCELNFSLRRLNWRQSQIRWLLSLIRRSKRCKKKNIVLSLI